MTNPLDQQIAADPATIRPMTLRRRVCLALVEALIPDDEKQRLHAQAEERRRRAAELLDRLGKK